MKELYLNVRSHLLKVTLKKTTLLNKYDFCNAKKYLPNLFVLKFQLFNIALSSFQVVWVFLILFFLPSHCLPPHFLEREIVSCS